MSFVPEVVTPEYAEIATRADHSHIRDLKYPGDCKRIAGLSLAEKVIWYTAQDPHTHIEAGADFHSFWFWHYVAPLKAKRFLYWFKFW